MYVGYHVGGDALNTLPVSMSYSSWVIFIQMFCTSHISKAKMIDEKIETYSKIDN